MSESVKWHLKIEHLMACNCNYGCPCSFNAPPTYDTCESALAYHIVEGQYGEVVLDGLNWVLAAYWPGPLHELDGYGIVYLDERADEAQRQALQAIATGQAGGPIGIFMSTVNAGIEVHTAPIELHFADKESWFRVPDLVEVVFEPIRSPVSGDEHLPSALLPTGMLTNREDFYSAKKFWVNARDDLRFEYPRQNAIAFNHTWSGP